eukprot:2207783-Pleurochrysis_carterae.AAC.3
MAAALCAPRGERARLDDRLAANISGLHTPSVAAARAPETCAHARVVRRAKGCCHVRAGGARAPRHECQLGLARFGGRASSAAVPPARRRCTPMHTRCRAPTAAALRAPEARAHDRMTD